jgi:hypothetical protein
MSRSTISMRSIMSRILVVSAAILLAEQAAPAAGPVTLIAVSGQLSGGNFVSATCAVPTPGQIGGARRLYGTNRSNGYSYSYAFNINQLSTAGGKLTLTGKFTSNGAPVTLTASVPSGPMSFTYVVNGKSYTYTGTGTVTKY